MWYSLFKTGLFRPYVRLVMRPTVVGAENIPQTGGALLACNHLSAVDTFMLPTTIERPMVFPAKAELFKGNRGLKSKLIASFLTAVKQVPMDRGGGRASAHGLQPVLDVLRGGSLVGIFPEGTRSPDGRLYKGKTGVARLALEAAVPVIPVGVVGTELVRGPLGFRNTRRPRIIIGEPLDVSSHAQTLAEQRTLRLVTDQVMAAIQQLTGQVYVDVYGSRVKHGDLAGQDVSDRIRTTPGSDDA